MLDLIVLILILSVVCSLGFGLFYLIKYQGQGNKLIYSLTWRVSLSLVAFFIITIGILTGYMH